jgi:hypothetical protein
VTRSPAQRLLSIGLAVGAVAGTAVCTVLIVMGYLWQRPFVGFRSPLLLGLAVLGACLVATIRQVGQRWNAAAGRQVEDTGRRNAATTRQAVSGLVLLFVMVLGCGVAFGGWVTERKTLATSTGDQGACPHPVREHERLYCLTQDEFRRKRIADQRAAFGILLVLYAGCAGVLVDARPWRREE